MLPELSVIAACVCVCWLFEFVMLRIVLYSFDGRVLWNVGGSVSVL